MKASDNAFPKLLLAVEASTGTPASGQFAVFAKSDGLYYVDDSGEEHAVGGASGVQSIVGGDNINVDSTDP
jgi:hypothetical protein